MSAGGKPDYLTLSRRPGDALAGLTAAGAGGTCALIPGPVRSANGALPGNHTQFANAETGRYSRLNPPRTLQWLSDKNRKGKRRANDVRSYERGVSLLAQKLEAVAISAHRGCIFILLILQRTSAPRGLSGSAYCS